MPADFNLINEILTVDAEELEIAEQSYGDSWKQRGGVGAFMMLARKWDRIENQCEKHHYDIFHACVSLNDSMEKFLKEDGLIDDIRDLRRYLLLVEQYVISGLSGTVSCEAAEAGTGYVDQG